MTDYGDQGATPTEDAVVDDPPTVADVAAAQERDHPEQVPGAGETEGPGSGGD
jgi:hypothetical protein